jgi:leukocyte elastase inhibitor
MPMISVHHVGRMLVAVAALASNASTPARADDLAALRALTAAYNASGHDLFVKLAATPGNIVFSPYSIGTAMAMALAGARRETEREMATVLRHTLPRGAIDAANAGLLAVLNGYDRSAEPPCPAGATQLGELGSVIVCDAALPPNGDCSSGLSGPSRTMRIGERCRIEVLRPRSAQLRTANALMVMKGPGGIISSDYARLVGDRYQAQVFHDADLDAVNRWVSQRTEGRIERILDRLDPHDVAVILNAVYFKASWQQTFVETHDGEFSLTAAAKVKVAMMSVREKFSVVQRPGFRAVRLPYYVPLLSMVIVRPDEVDGATRLAGELDANALAALFRELNAPKMVAVKLPRFKTSFSARLRPLFEQAGMIRAFDLARADFSGMTGERQQAFAIDAIEHRAVIDVNESGTEAAAATVDTILTMGRATAVEPFVVDRPFLFYIVDDATGAILFEGRISDPRAQS